jgi:hypothetical protein
LASRRIASADKKPPVFEKHNNLDQPQVSGVTPEKTRETRVLLKFSSINSATARPRRFWDGGNTVHPKMETTFSISFGRHKG